MNDQLSYIQGYKSMYFFLCEYENAQIHEDISSLLGDLLFIDHGDELSTSDPASWDYWVESIHSTLPESQDLKNGCLTYLQAFKSMVYFLQEYHRATSSKEIEAVLKDLVHILSDDENSPHNSIIWNRWLINIQKAFSANSSAD
jgi:hypothetical protein